MNRKSFNDYMYKCLGISQILGAKSGMMHVGGCGVHCVIDPFMFGGVDVLKVNENCMFNEVSMTLKVRLSYRNMTRCYVFWLTEELNMYVLLY